MMDKRARQGRIGNKFYLKIYDGHTRVGFSYVHYRGVELLTLMPRIPCGAELLVRVELE